MSRVIPAFAQFFDSAGDPLSGGWLRFLESETNNTDKATYVDEGMTLANENPLQLDADGRCPSVFGTGNYRVVLYADSLDDSGPGETITSFDPVWTQYTGGDLVAWEEEGIVLRPVTHRQGQIGDSAHAINSIYIEDDGRINLGDQQDFYITYSSANEVLFVLNATTKNFSFNSHITLPSDISIFFGDAQNAKLHYDSTNQQLELDDYEIISFVGNQLAGLNSKTSPVDGDYVIIEDSEDGYAKKKVLLSDLKTYFNAP